MKKFIFLLCIGLLFTAIESLHAQIALEILLERRNYIQYEPLNVKVKMRNDSAQPLAFGKNENLHGELSFEVIDKDRRPLRKVNISALEFNNFILRAGENREVVVPLNKMFKLVEPGVYRVYAYMKHAALPDTYRSNEMSFEINVGSTVWERTAGVPKLMGNNTKKMLPRTYKVKALLNATQKFYFLIVEDEKRIYAIYCLGPVLTEDYFQADIDMISQLHVLFPYSQRLMRYYVFDISGQMITDKLYNASSTSIPGLSRDPFSGKITLVGGNQISDGDIDPLLNRDLNRMPGGEELNEINANAAAKNSTKENSALANESDLSQSAAPEAAPAPVANTPAENKSTPELPNTPDADNSTPAPAENNSNAAINPSENVAQESPAAVSAKENTTPEVVKESQWTDIFTEIFVSQEAEDENSSTPKANVPVENIPHPTTQFAPVESAAETPAQPAAPAAVEPNDSSTDELKPAAVIAEPESKSEINDTENKTSSWTDFFTNLF